MVYFQSAFKHRGMIFAGVILALTLALGCSVRNAENMAEKDSAAQTQAVSESVDGSAAATHTISGVSLVQDDQTQTVLIQGTSPLEYTSIKQAFPFAVAVYLPDTTLGDQIGPSVGDNADITGIRASYADKENTTAKIEILLKKDLPYTVKEDGNTLAVVFRRTPAPVADVEPQIMKTVKAKAAPKSQSMAKAEEVPAAVSQIPATLTHIEFDTVETGQSDIRLQTSHPIRYEARQVSPGQIHLILFNTTIPQVHQRPLLTRYFNSAVEKIEPKQGQEGSKDAYIDITIRDMVPYQLAQSREGLHMAFEPSAVAPPRFDKAEVSLTSGSVSSGTVMPKGPHPTMAAMAGQNIPAPAVADTFSDTAPTYTGEKIKLDFFDTDIKNVFRILRSVSGLNFAIDDDVQGKVTLSLDEPVPWDQVMDLVLKMNGLGKKMEGNVVRIATLETMATEEKALQDAISARKKSMEQKESLAPLVTEYIPINYSDAVKDVQPHVQQILTPDRGKLSVDQRTNMIIITDTQAKIDQAQELIYRLDTVTPQIMIEARVVEVTKEFSRNVGLKWNMTNASSTISGFVDDYNVAVNQPNAGVAGNFSFFRLFGSSVNALNAQLEASEELGDVRIVSSPRILTLDNKKAKIKQGLEYAYLERDDAGGSSVQFKNIDLLLEVTPHVTPDKRISMTVFLTKNDVAGVTATGVPTLATNEAETELLVNNNETVVIGGVVKTTKNDGQSGVPFMTGIPVLGALFGVTQKTDNRNELLIFLTPSIVQLEQRRHVSAPGN